jgi:hypothetical protein
MLPWKTRSVTYSDSVSVTILIQHAKHVRLIFSSVACLALPYFSIVCHTRQDFRERVIEHKICVFIFSTNFVWSISHVSKNSVRMYIGLHVKCPLSSSDFNKIWIFSTDFQKILRYQISWKSVQWEPSCSMQTDGQTDRHEKANSCFSKFCEGAQKFVENFIQHLCLNV